MKNESGRSMVEMLGVLAIIGVLSIGGIAGYTLAMRRYKANNVVNTMSLAAIYGMTANGGEGVTPAKSLVDLTSSASKLGMSSYPSEISKLYATSEGVVEVQFAADQKEVCELVKDILNNKLASSGDVSGTYTATSCSSATVNKSVVNAKFN